MIKPSNSAEKMKMASANNVKMSSVSSAMNNQQAGNSICDNTTSSINSEMESLSNNPFVLNKTGKMQQLRSSSIQVSGWKKATIQTATSLSNVYQDLLRSNNALAYGNLGTRIAKQDQVNRQKQSLRSRRVNIAYDPAFSASVSNSKSASASLAKLPKSTRDSLLNSVAAQHYSNKGYGLGVDNNVTNVSPLPTNNGSNGNVNGDWTLSDYNNGGNNQ